MHYLLKLFRICSECSVNSKLRNMLLCVLLQTVTGKDWDHSFIEPDWKHRISKYTAKSRNSEQTSFCARYSEQSLNITEHSE
jgi:hypothetical protein